MGGHAKGLHMCCATSCVVHAAVPRGTRLRHGTALQITSCRVQRTFLRLRWAGFPLIHVRSLAKARYTSGARALSAELLRTHLLPQQGRTQPLEQRLHVVPGGHPEVISGWTIPQRENGGGTKPFWALSVHVYDQRENYMYM